MLKAASNWWTSSAGTLKFHKCPSAGLPFMLCVFCSENWLLLTPTVSKQETELQIPTTLPSSKSPEAKRSFELLEKAFLRRVPEALH